MQAMWAIAHSPSALTGSRKPVALEPAEAERQHTLRYAVDLPPQFGKTARAVAKRHNDLHAPLVANAVEDGRDAAAHRAVGVGISGRRSGGLEGSHTHVP